METIIISLFVLGYLAITLEHNLKVDKLIPALAMMALMWAIISLAHLPVFDVNTELKELEPTHIDEILLHHLGKTAEIIIFLLGAMTIVEIIWQEGISDPVDILIRVDLPPRDCQSLAPTILPIRHRR